MKVTSTLAGTQGIRRPLKPCAMLFSAAACFWAGSLINSSVVRAQDMSHGADNFYKSEKVIMQKATFNNQYKMKVAGNLFVPTGLEKNSKSAAIIVGHPMGAVKEQSASLYATKMAEEGLICFTRQWDICRFRSGDGLSLQGSMP